jgi:hypothetical protein
MNKARGARMRTTLSQPTRTVDHIVTNVRSYFATSAEAFAYFGSAIPRR